MKSEIQPSTETLKREKQALEEAMQMATEAIQNGGRKVMAPTVEVDGEKFYIVDDGATRRIIPA